MRLGAKFIDAMSVAIKGTSLVILLGSRVFLAAAGLAQSSVAPSPVATPAGPQPAMINSGQNLPAAKAPQSRAVTSATPAKGAHEGIQVHGYWTIEVRNPDGTVTAHREFENSIQTAGQDYLESLLTGQAVPGGMAIALDGADITTTYGTCGLAQCVWGGYYPQFADPGPCLPFGYNAGSPVTFAYPYSSILTGGPSTGTTCLIVPPISGSGPISWLASLCWNQASSSCGTNLSTQGLSGTGLGSSGASPFLPLTLTGSVTVASTGVNPGTINDVETLFVTCPSPNQAPSTCENFFSSISAFGATGFANLPPSILLYLFTMKTLDGVSGDPQPVPYQPGQTIAVTVQISFQ